MDRAMEAGIDDVGLGVLFGLNTYKYDFIGLLMHAEHLEATFGVCPHTMSVHASVRLTIFPQTTSPMLFPMIYSAAL